MDNRQEEINEDSTTSFQVQVTINGQEVNVSGNEAANDSNERRNEAAGPEQCPQCGDTIEGLSKICPSCGYIPNKDSMKDALSELQGLMGQLRFTKKTWGKDYENLLTAVGYQMIAARLHYGQNPEVKEALQKYAEEKEALVKKGKTHMVRSGLISGGISIIIIAAVIILWRLVLSK